MRQVSRIAFAALACVTLAPAVASPAHANDCKPGAIEKLRALSPDGFAIYKAMTDKAFFNNWITCDNVPLGLSTAVHESTHYITAEIDAFPLLNGGKIKRPHQVSSFFAPTLIAKKFKGSDYVTTYLRPGQSSSATDFLYLLDELNAYSHDLNASIDLKSLSPPDQEADNRDGLAAAMAFVAVYAQTAEENQPATWAGLQQPEVARTVAALWGRAEKVMASSCGIPNFGAEDKMFIRQFCQPGAQSSLETIIGRAPVCPTACLKPAPEAEQASDTVEDVTATGSVRRKRAANLPISRPFWRGGGMGRRPLGSNDVETD